MHLSGAFIWHVRTRTHQLSHCGNRVREWDGPNEEERKKNIALLHHKEQEGGGGVRGKTQCHGNCFAAINNSHFWLHLKRADGAGDGNVGDDGYATGTAHHLRTQWSKWFHAGTISLWDRNLFTFFFLLCVVVHAPLLFALVIADTRLFHFETTPNTNTHPLTRRHALTMRKCAVQKRKIYNACLVNDVAFRAFHSKRIKMIFVCLIWMWTFFFSFASFFFFFYLFSHSLIRLSSTLIFYVFVENEEKKMHYLYSFILVAPVDQCAPIAQAQGNWTEHIYL